MKKQSGNFLLQALMALALVVMFMPLFTQKLAQRDIGAQMFGTQSQIENASSAARIYIRENLNALNYNRTVLSGDKFSDTLEPYGLPLGFVPKTVFGGDISLVIDKNQTKTFAHLEISRGKMSGIQMAELNRRIGFYSSMTDDTIFVIIPYDDIFSDLVRRNDKNPDENGFLSDLDMGGFGFDDAGAIFARTGEFESYQTNTLSVFGTEDGRKIRNKIEELTAFKSVFQGAQNESALTITRGVLTANAVSAKTISKFGGASALTTDSASAFDFSMTAGRNSFSGPNKWDIRGDLVSDNINFTFQTLEVASSINATRGQNVFINPDSLQYSSKSGIEVDKIKIENITLRDQTSASILQGGTGDIVIDIRVSGTSVLPDVLIDTIDNGSFKIIANPSGTDGATVSCESVIRNLSGVYNQKSLSQNIICQYVFWQRLEKRIDIKKCMLDGRSDCK